MCGIGVVISIGGDAEITDTHSRNENAVLERRGPDHVSTLSKPPVTLTATVLHMRGDHLSKQPVSVAYKNRTGHLCWNGEIYQYTNMNMSTASKETNTCTCTEKESEHLHVLEVPSGHSDTQSVANLLSEALTGCDLERERERECECESSSTKLESIASAFSNIHNGEFAFCFLTDDALYYGRDSLGRRSLLISEPSQQSHENDTCNDWRLASVATCTNRNWQEVPPGRVFEYKLTGQNKGAIRSTPLTVVTTSANVHVSRNDLLAVGGSSDPGVSDTMWKASVLFEQLLFQAVQRRLECFRHHQTEPIGVMFSGGLDSVVLAGMAAKLLQRNQTLELYNVAFGNSKAADRQAGLQCYQELKANHADKDIQLVLVDISDWESVVEEEKRVQQLIFPKTSVMDLNIGTALWFGSRGVGTVDGQVYHSRAKILILGMGADEQLGGYGRHRKASREGTLREELDLDIGRIWERNLGRDDRVLSDHGKEARFPFLDPIVMQFLASTPVNDICDFSMDPGQGDKRILRLVAQRMGMTTASGLVKRAIQFGSRIAHLSDKQHFGSRRKAKGTAHFRGKQNPGPD